MLCCSRENKMLLGMARVNTAEVIRACKSVLNSIYRWRSDHRRQYVNEYIESARWWHKYFWWAGASKPTTRNALLSYYHSSSIPPHFSAIMTFGQQEDTCKKILRVAEATHNATMWISPEGASACRL